MLIFQYLLLPPLGEGWDGGMMALLARLAPTLALPQRGRRIKIQQNLRPTPAQHHARRVQGRNGNLGHQAGVHHAHIAQAFDAQIGGCYGRSRVIAHAAAAGKVVGRHAGFVYPLPQRLAAHALLRAFR